MIVPLRRLIPSIGMIDITPIVAYLLLSWVLERVVIGILRGIIGV